MAVRSAARIALSLAVAVSPASAITIDNFEEGPFSVSGSNSVQCHELGPRGPIFCLGAQSGLSTLNVISGQRTVAFPAVEGATADLALTAGDDSAVVSAPTQTFFTFSYQFASPFDLTLGGSLDRFVVDITAASGTPELGFQVFNGSYFAAISEPSTALLVGCGLLALAAGRRQARHSSAQRCSPLGFLAVTLLSIGSGCSSTHPVVLTYHSPANLAPPAGSPMFAIAEVVDQRQIGPNELGGVRSGFGNLLKRLQSSEPVADLVSRALQDALRARGLLADGHEARILLRTVITKLDCHFFTYSAPGAGAGGPVGTREAHAHLDVEALDADTKSLLWKETYAADLFEPATGAAIFADVDALRSLAERAMTQAVDRAVTDSRVRSQASAGRDS